MMDRGWPEWDDFGHEEASWVRNLAQTAIARKSSLRMIRISFYPLYFDHQDQCDDYPWDRTDALNKEFRPQGIAITYTKPPKTKEAWAWDRDNTDALFFEP
jgi:hypothetical protein